MTYIYFLSETTLDMDATAKFINAVGFPVSLVAVIIFFAWKVGNFVAPRLVESFDKHDSFVDTMREQEPKRTEAAKGVQEALTELVAQTVGTNEALDASADVFDALAPDNPGVRAGTKRMRHALRDKQTKPR